MPPDQPDPSSALKQLQEEHAELRRRLEEAEETISAIQTGAVDALVIEEGTGHRIYTLEGAERPYRLFVEAMQQGAATLYPDGTIVWCNRQLAALLKTPCERLIGASLQSFVSPGSLATCENLLWQGKTRSGQGEAQLRRADGAAVPVFLTFNSLPLDSGAAIGALVTDLTPQRHHEQLTKAHAALRETERQLALVADTAPVFIAHCDTETRFKFVNKPYAKRFGLSAGDCIGRRIAEITGEAQYELIRAYVETVLSGQAVEFELEIPHERLGRRVMHCSYAPDFGPGGDVIGFVAAIIDISGRKQIEEALRESQTENDRQRRVYEAILTNTLDFAYVFDLDHRFTYANEILLRTWGRTRDEALGKTCLELGYEPGHAAMHDREIETVVATKQPIRGEVPFEGTFGRRIYDYIFVPVLGANGEVEAIAGTTRDITERKQAEEALRESGQRYRELFDTAEAARVSAEAAKQRAEAAGRAKDDFLAALSHELRTPLNPALLLATALARDPDVPAPMRTDLEAITRGITLQVRLIDDLLDLTRITGGKLSLELQPMDAHAAIRQTLEMVERESRERHIAVTLDLAAAQSGILADAVRMQQVFWNVIKNAVKFTPPGGGITVRTLMSPDNPGVLAVEVTDTGIGIHPEMLETIFNSFAQEHHEGAHRFGGLGLGLAITRRLVEMHHGCIRAHSDGRHRGATFRIEVPLAVMAPGFAALPKLPEDSVIENSRRRILLVEDHDMTRESLARLLGRRGHRVFPARTVAEARELATVKKCDLVISDIGLPDGDGHTLMSALQHAGGLPGIAMSGYGADDDLRRSKECGFFTHLTKPVSILALEAAIAAAPPVPPPA